MQQRPPPYLCCYSVIRAWVLLRFSWWTNVSGRTKSKAEVFLSFMNTNRWTAALKWWSGHLWLFLPFHIVEQRQVCIGGIFVHVININEFYITAHDGQLPFRVDQPNWAESFHTIFKWVYSIAFYQPRRYNSLHGLDNTLIFLNRARLFRNNSPMWMTSGQWTKACPGQMCCPQWSSDLESYPIHPPLQLVVIPPLDWPWKKAQQ